MTLTVYKSSIFDIVSYLEIHNKLYVWEISFYNPPDKIKDISIWYRWLLVKEYCLVNKFIFSKTIITDNNRLSMLTEYHYSLKTTKKISISDVKSYFTPLHMMSDMTERIENCSEHNSTNCNHKVNCEKYWDWYFIDKHSYHCHFLILLKIYQTNSEKRESCP